MADPFSDIVNNNQDPFSDIVEQQPSSTEGFLQNAINKVSNLGNKTGGFIQKQIQSQRFMGDPTSPLGMIPSSGQELMDAGKVGIKSIISPNRFGPVGMGASMVDPTSGFKQELMNSDFNKMFKPETPYGKALDVASPLAQIIYGAGEGGSALYDRFLNPGGLPEQLNVNQSLQDKLGDEGQRLNGIQDYIGQRGTREVKNAADGGEVDRLNNIQDYINKRGQREVGNVENKGADEISNLKDQGKQLKENFRGNSEDLAYRGSEDIQKQVQSKFESAQQHYNSMLDSQEMPNLTDKDLLGPLNKTIENKGIENKQPMFRDSSENHMMSMRDKISSQIVPGGEDTVDPLTNQVVKGADAQAPGLDKVTDIKDYKNKVMSGLKGRPDLQAEFMNHYGDFLKSNGLNDFAEAGKPYQDAYAALDASKDLGKTTLTRATGTMQGSEFSDLSNQEGKVGTDYLQQAKGMKEQHGTDQQNILNKISEAEQKLAKMSQQVKTKYAGASSSMSDKIASAEQNLEQLGQKVKTKYAGAKSSIQDLIEGNKSQLESAQGRRPELQNRLDRINSRRKFAENWIVKPAIGGAIGGEGYELSKSIHDLLSPQKNQR